MLLRGRRECRGDGDNYEVPMARRHVLMNQQQRPTTMRRHMKPPVVLYSSLHSVFSRPCVVVGCLHGGMAVGLPGYAQRASAKNKVGRRCTRRLLRPTKLVTFSVYYHPHNHSRLGDNNSLSCLEREETTGRSENADRPNESLHQTLTP